MKTFCHARPMLQLALRYPVDVVEGLAVVKSLVTLNDGGQVVPKELAARHPAHAVRGVAVRALVEFIKRGETHA